ncbi:DnaA regulatory inactivator Hda [Gilvimarinus sp. SDUM040013]|uniref:DnaA regulatory inactivator Hda n=1 Tax=Gilvimarinus gilvus TaxID=3058038 RepID=A0ABU4S2P2_9GAMM|nr:DnaA regulatory inactivator Hda [Gilvimarinus sp. SDUM040013]MDO3384552.1 DnaA regulatory inactivator Hda [Gilvimarinus sp. SDUM040013]MDX6850113.1 DnaA regulatory inactivator Hda [Gilvimarinus sp. SDUM040013]
MGSAPQQLSLGVSLKDDATFANFFAPEHSVNLEVVNCLKAQVENNGEQFVYLWGASGAGLTHLLQASCHYAESMGVNVQYLPLNDVMGFAPEALLEGLEHMDLVCLDGLDAIAGNAQWERALFNLYNALRDSGKLLLVAATHNPRSLGVHLADLQSRFQWGVIYAVESLGDDEKIQALRKRAKERGLDLSADVANYIVQRVPRDMNQLFCCLHKLDHASLAEQRKLTIPFVKKTLGL